jgi:hypothetical protein
VDWLSLYHLGYELDEEIVQFLAEVDLSLFQSNPDYIWGPSSLLSSEYQGSFPTGKVASF